MGLLNPSDAMGHLMYVAGLPPNQYFWCDRCGAHTAKRARNLTKSCPKIMRNPAVAKLLRDGKHPYDDGHPLLSTMPRRLTYRDVGPSAKRCKSDSEASITGIDEELPSVLRPPNPAVAQHHAYEVEFDTNPFGFPVNFD